VSITVHLGKGEMPRHHWALRYLLDWGRCGKTLKPVRAYTTVLRWYPHPAGRLRALAHLRHWAADTPWNLHPQHERNLVTLLQAHVKVGPSWSAARMGLFLSSLRFGDLIRGGDTPDTVPPWMLKWRPGYAWVLGKWLRVFPVDPIPWPWWIWLTPDEIAELQP
jgi:hypothetical protein